MKKYLILFILMGIGWSQNQITHKGTQELFEGFVNDDTTKVQMIASKNTKLSGVYPYTYANKQFEYWVLTDSSTTARTFYSIIQNTRNLWGTIYITARADSIAGTMETRLQLGLYRGYGYGSNDGMEWKYIGTLNGTADSLGVSLADSTWWIEDITTDYQYRFVEDSSGAADYILHEFLFEEN